MYKKGKGLEILEPILASNADTDQVATCIKIGLLCTQFDHHMRPTMSRVALMLSRKSGTLDEPTPPGYLGSRRRSRGHGTSSSSDGMSHGSNSRTRSSTTNTTTAATATATTTAPRTPRRHVSSSSDPQRRRLGSTSAGPLSDPYGKRPMRE